MPTNGDKYSEIDCPYRSNLLTDDMDCHPAFGCEKGFDPGQLERGDLIGDIVCWLEEQEEE